MATATIKELRSWMVRDLLRPNFQIHRPTEKSSTEDRFRATIYTKTTEYHISAIERYAGKSYLGCIAASRKSRPGEDWTRGNDLPDGNLSKKTWRQILAGIVRYEAQRISSECDDNENTKG
ncbi:hypothetical protein LCGC14_1910730 [marine sediment metagenome]|uniref:Uncharacterized protein n=1 Tax=marine sediment metagenome TaxID=412755 RepID=A0A0F9FUA4_9ZZZZ